MANILLARRGSSNTKRVGKSWVARYVKRQKGIKSKYSRALEYVRAKAQDPIIFNNWFELVKSTIEIYGIHNDDIYNFDETGFAMGRTGTAKVIGRSDIHGRRATIEPGNREWVTTIECTNASGWALSPRIIFKGKRKMRYWFQERLPTNWFFDTSKNGWTSDKIALRWLKNTFIKETEGRTKGVYRLLILDGHGSHLTPEFDEICVKHNIVTLCMPPHSSHLLQPLDVSCFGPLKTYYHLLITDLSRGGAIEIDKSDFLLAYPEARRLTFTKETIMNSFKFAGILPLDANRVISKLNVQLTTPDSTSSLSNDEEEETEPRTPTDFADLQRVESRIKALRENCLSFPSSPEKKMVGQIIKGSQILMHQLTFLECEIEDLRNELSRKKKKQNRSRKQITHEGDLSVGEVLEQFPETPVASEAESTETQVESMPTLQPPFRRTYRCSVCKANGHRKDKCPTLSGK